MTDEFNKDRYTNQRNLISIVGPFYDESEGIETLYQTILPVLDDSQGVRFEIVCVDDGSRDDTLLYLNGLGLS